MNLEISKNYRQAWSNFLKEIWCFKKELLIIIISATLTAIMTILAPVYAQEILKQIETPDWSIASIVLILVAIILVNGISYFITNYYSRNISIKIEVELRNQMLKTMHLFPEEHFYNLQTGGFFSRIISDLKDIKSFSFKFIGSFISIIILTGGSFIYLFVFDYRIALIILIIFLLPFFVYLFVFKSLAYQRQQAKIRNTQIQISLGERLENLREIKVSNQIEKSIKNFANVQNVYQKSWCKLNFKLSLLEILGFSFALIMTNVITIISYYFLHDTPKWQDLSFLLAVVNLIVIPTKDIAKFMNSVILANAAIVRYNDFFGWETEKGENNKHNFKGLIEIKNLTFNFDAYDKNKKPLFSKFNLSIKKGEHLVFKKDDFFGRTTFLKLLLKFYSVGDNSIFFDKVDINKIDLMEIRKNISYLPCEPKLMSKLFLSFDSTIDIKKLDKILDALEIKNIFYKNYLNHSDENSTGKYLSSSEKILIAFAHICWENKQIILLDNPFAFLNQKQANNVKAIIKNSFKNKTVIICE